MSPDQRILRLENQVQVLVTEANALLTLCGEVITALPDSDPSDYQRKLRLLVLVQQRRESLKTIRPLNSNSY